MRNALAEIATLMTENVITTEQIMDYDRDDDLTLRMMPAEDLLTRVKQYRASPIHSRGATLPYGSTHDKIRFRPTEVTVWAGVNGGGKSLLTGMVCLSFVGQGEPCLVVSLEMTPEATLSRMIDQAAMNDTAPDSFVDGAFRNAITSGLYIFDYVGNLKPNMLYALIKYATAERGVKHVFIDSLMKVVEGADDYNAQKEVVNRITRLAQECDCHIHLIHHLRKPSDDEKPPTKWEMKGDSSVSDMPDQVILMHRNRKKERTLRFNPEDQDALASEDALMVVEKNRHGGWEGAVRLWLHRASQQFVADPKARPINLFETFL